ncbi:hypothetical protein [Salinibacterium sp.]|uniref:hypothetical protein n=1 Tax=Salinibacterium sp. TaxID=1915057 RepID=UPI00286AFFF3|nr:hypothetical protein [Salinibacterium sp.]
MRMTNDFRAVEYEGGVGLCETVQHPSTFDFVVVARTMEERMVKPTASGGGL